MHMYTYTCTFTHVVMYTLHALPVNRKYNLLLSETCKLCNNFGKLSYSSIVARYTYYWLPSSLTGSVPLIKRTNGSLEATVFVCFDLLSEGEREREGERDEREREID